jgi:hypothetical protein
MISAPSLVLYETQIHLRGWNEQFVNTIAIYWLLIYKTISIKFWAGEIQPFLSLGATPNYIAPVAISKYASS